MNEQERNTAEWIMFVAGQEKNDSGWAAVIEDEIKYFGGLAEFNKYRDMRTEQNIKAFDELCRKSREASIANYKRAGREIV